jgi:hypothetical protein
MDSAATRLATFWSAGNPRQNALTNGFMPRTDLGETSVAFLSAEATPDLDSKHARTVHHVPDPPVRERDYGSFCNKRFAVLSTIMFCIVFVGLALDGCWDSWFEHAAKAVSVAPHRGDLQAEESV